MPELILKHLKSIFAILVLLGVAVILGFTLLPGPHSPSRHWVMIGIVVTLMLFYGAVVWLRSKTQYSTEDDAETFYYLGFIFTLVTLVATFVPLLATETKLESKMVLGLFGLGLITTFVGLVGRVFFYQLPVATPDSVDEHVRRLSNAYAEAARAIEASTPQITKARSQADEHLKEVYSATVTAIRTVAERANQEYSHFTTEAARQLTDMIGDASRRAESVLKELESRVFALRLPPAELGDRLGAVLHDLVQRGEKLGQAMESLEGGFGALDRGLSNALKSVAEGATALGGLGGAASTASVSISSATQNIEALSSRLAALTQPLNEVLKASDKIQEIARSLDVLSKAIGEAGAEWKNFAAGAKMAGKSASSAGTAIANLESSARSVAQSTINMGGSLQRVSEQSNTLAETAARAAKLAEGMVDAQRRLSEQISSDVIELIRKYEDVVRKLGDSFGEDLKASEDAVRQVHQNLIDASRFIIAQVK